MSDIYEFAKSNLPQGIQMETPMSQKNFSFIQDINNGSYSAGSGQSLVQFDLASIYNSSKLFNPSEAFLAIPITYATVWTDTNGATVAPLTNAWASTGLKGGYWNLLNSVDCTVGGKVLDQAINGINQYVSVRMLSSLSKDDLEGIGSTIGLGDTIDNWESMCYTNSGVNSITTGGAVNSLTPTCIANGISNNQPFPLNLPVCSQALGATACTTTSATLTGSASGGTITVGQLITGAGVSPLTYVSAISGTTLTLSQAANIPASATLYFYNNQLGNAGDGQSPQIQYSGSYNNGLYSRLKRIPDTTVAATKNYANLFGGTNCITSSSLMKNEFRPYFTVSSNVCYWYDVAIIRMKDILDSFDKMPMLKRFDCQMRLNFNVGSVVSNIVGGVGNGYQVMSGSSCTFTGTTSILQCALNAYPANAVCMTSGIFIGSPQSTAISVKGGTVNLFASGSSHFMNACRFYYSQIELKPEKLQHYISSNRAKKVCYTNVLTNNFTNISANATTSVLCQSGVSNIKGIWILPYINATSNGLVGGAQSSYVSAFSQLLSPFDTAPITFSPISLTNLQVQVGGVNALATPINYSYEHWLEQVGLYEQINAGDIGLSNFVYSQAQWENSRCYYVNLERCNNADLMSLRSVAISFTNNSNVAIDIVVFVEKMNEITVDVELGTIDV